MTTQPHWYICTVCHARELMLRPGKCAFCPTGRMVREAAKAH